MNGTPSRDERDHVAGRALPGHQNVSAYSVVRNLRVHVILSITGSQSSRQEKNIRTL